MNYLCLKQQEFAKGDYTLVPFREEDLFLIMDWRNAQMAILRQKTPLTHEEQETYYNDVILPSGNEEHPKQILFSILLKGKCIGYGGLVHIDWGANEAEVSFLVDSVRKEGSPHYVSDFKAFLQMIKVAAFGDLGLDTLMTETYDVRPVHIATLESEGFVEERRIKEGKEINGVKIDSIIHRCRRV